MPVTILATRDGKLDAADQPAFAQLVQRLTTKPSKVMVHLHGGLTNETDGRATAARLAGAAPGGFGLGDDWEQIYVVWRTGFLETLQTNWPDLLEDDRLYRTVLKKILGFVASKLGVQDGSSRSVFDAVSLSAREIDRRLANPPDGDPFVDVSLLLTDSTNAGARVVTVQNETDAELDAQFSLSLQLDSEFMDVAEDVSAALTSEQTQGRTVLPNGDITRGSKIIDDLDPELKAGLIGTSSTSAPGRTEASGRFVVTSVEVAKFLIKHAVAIAIRVIRRFREQRDHGFYPTTVEELVREMYGARVGSAIWGMMKKDAADHFTDHGFGAALVAAFVASPPTRLAISGHSAGSIWATQMVNALKPVPDPPRLRIAFMAPAVRMDLFADAVKEATPVIEGFRMFAMSDDLEAKDSLLGPGKGFVYPRSLLYLVSGICEENDDKAFADAPLLGMARFLKGDPATWKDASQIAAAQASIAYVTGSPHCVAYSKTTGVPGKSTTSISHGGFDDDPATLESIVSFFSEP